MYIFHTCCTTHVHVHVYTRYIVVCALSTLPPKLTSCVTEDSQLYSKDAQSLWGIFSNVLTVVHETQEEPRNQLGYYLGIVMHMHTHYLLISDCHPLIMPEASPDL